MWAKFQNDRQSYLHPLESSTFQGSVFWTLALSYLSGIISALTKKYQQKRKKVTKLIDTWIDIITPALVIFERAVSKSLKNGIIDEEEFNTLQMLHLEMLKELTSIDCRMEVEHRSLVEKSLLEEINNVKKKAGTKA